jgi:hypothetical protein
MPVPKGTRIGGRQKGTLNKATADVKVAASAYTASAISTLASIMQDPEEASPARVAAAKELLDRAHGKPKQSVDVDATVRTDPVGEMMESIAASGRPRPKAA